MIVLDALMIGMVVVYIQSMGWYTTFSYFHFVLCRQYLIQSCSLGGRKFIACPARCPDDRFYRWYREWILFPLNMW